MTRESDDRRIESRFESIFNHVNEGILIANRQGQIVLTNPRISQLFGYSDEEIRGLPVEQLIPEHKREKHEEYRESFMRHPVKRPMGKNLTLFARRKDGSEFPVEISLSHYQTGEGLYVIAFVIDITERFEQQQNIQRINEELKQLNESLERKVGERTLVLKEALNSLESSRDELSDALDKEKELNEMKSRFISMASHEFRTPLATILSSVSLISKYTTGEEQDKRDKHIGRIKSAVSNLTDILNDFLSLGKLEEGMLLAKLQSHDLCQCIEEVVAELSGILRKDQSIVHSHLGACDFVMDKQMFRNILINLVSNAIKFSKDGTAITIQSEVGPDGVEVSVRDQGIGISEEDQRHLFERFYRGKNAMNIQGTGLGLNIVLKYLELMEGNIRCESEIEVGSTFTFKIPYLEEQNL